VKAAQEAEAREEIEVTEVDLVEEVAQDPEQESPGSALTEKSSSSSTRDQEKDSKERPEETIPTTSTLAPAEEPESQLTEREATARATGAISLTLPIREAQPEPRESNKIQHRLPMLPLSPERSQPRPRRLRRRRSQNPRRSLKKLLASLLMISSRPKHSRERLKPGSQKVSRMPRSSMVRKPSPGQKTSKQPFSPPRTSSTSVAESLLTSCSDSRLVEMTRKPFHQEVEEEAEEVAEEVPKALEMAEMLAKEVAEDKIPSKALRRPRKISQLYEYDIFLINKALGRSSSIVVNSD